MARALEKTNENQHFSFSNLLLLVNFGPLLFATSCARHTVGEGVLRDTNPDGAEAFLFIEFAPVPRIPSAEPFSNDIIFLKFANYPFKT